MGSFPETYNDLEGLTLKYEWLIFIEKALKIGSVSWLLSSAFIKPLQCASLKENSPGVVSKRKHSKTKTKACSTKKAPKSQKQILKRLKKVDELLWT